MTRSIQEYVEELLRIMDALGEHVVLENGSLLKASLAILRERGKDRRQARIEEGEVTESKTEEFEPATDKQKSFMDHLKIPYPVDIDKDTASKLISEKID